MSEAQYKELITKTFQDNAIRSVVMIDDEYLRYDELLDQLVKGAANITDQRISITKKAVNLHNFFRTEKKISCDIDNGVGTIDADKIRKSDLVILDYQLDKDDPTKSIALIGQLQKNDHMNLVVLYTHAPPEEVWIRLAASLRDAKSLDSIALSSELPSPTLQKDWEEVTNFTGELPTDWDNWITNDDLSKYILTGDLGKHAISLFGKNHKNNGKPFRQLACEQKLASKNPSINASNMHDLDVRGSNGTVKWIQSGNVFVVIHSKSLDDNPEEPKELWDALTAGLVDWNPSYHQLLISEIQNSLENDGLSFDPSTTDIEAHAAWLSVTLQKNDASQRHDLSKQLIHQLVDDIRIKLSIKKTLIEFQNDSIEVLCAQKNSAQDKSFDEFSATHVKLNTTDANFSERIHHALNANFSSSTFTGKYITSGTIVREEHDETKWYLCVSPACDTVPIQIKGNLAKRLNPDRLLKFLVLSKINLGSALEDATSGRNVFICSDKNKRLAFTVQNEQYAPEVEYALIHNHNGLNDKIITNGVMASFLHRDDKKSSHLKEAKLIPVTQLRDSYTARYQTVASHHLGRVGVDYFDLKKPAASMHANNPV
jgi:Response receiver domain